MRNRIPIFILFLLLISSNVSCQQPKLEKVKKVTTIEKDENVIKIARMNEASKELFNNSKISFISLLSDIFSAVFANFRLLFAFFAELINRVIASGYHPAGMIDRELMPQKKIALVCANLRENRGLNTTLAGTASAAGYSPSHFARLFKRVTGHTFHEHINACRLERVKKLLNDNTPYKTIADMLGFAGKSTFSRWLSKYRHSLQV